MIAPLQLVDYRSDLLAYERLNADPVPDDVDLGVGLEIELDTHFDEDREAQCVELVVQFNAEKSLPDDVVSYVMHRGRCRVTGWLAWVDEQTAARADSERLLLVNGLSMLFGIARVKIADLTSDSDRRLVLPSISFKPIVEDFLEEGGGNEDGAEGSDNAS